MTTIEKISSVIRVVPDFPKKGISFKDITPLLGNSALFAETINLMAAPYKNAGITKVVGFEARGFLFAPAIAVALGAGVVPIRKKGKLPYETIAVTYQLEYGSDTIEMHADALTPTDKILLVDDVLATGGTAAAGLELCRKLGPQIVGAAFLGELAFLKGRKKLPGVEISCLLQF